ncbi:MAG TPA: thiamine phosphate synthase [Candidatus Eisenbacteria bacterium]|nr:thiamine phosphate synthase [Candidatus Eisenbacteria bacterium]
MRDLPGGVYAITDRRQARLPLATIVHAALSAGFAGVMLREKDLSGGPLFELASVLARICEDLERPLIVNDRLDVALALPRAGAHVGRNGVSVRDARRLLGKDRLLGYSAHEVSEAERAFRHGADYVTLSPIFPSESKLGLTPRGLQLLEDAARVLTYGHVIGLGGIDASNVASVRQAGAFGAAVMGAIMRVRDATVASRRIANAWASDSTEESP